MTYLTLFLNIKHVIFACLNIISDEKNFSPVYWNLFCRYYWM